MTLNKEKRAYIYRGLFYAAGLFILAFGITLNTKAGLGVSPIISVPYSISTIWDKNFGNMTLVVYLIFVLVEMILHIFFRKSAKTEEERTGAGQRRADLGWVLVADLLQFPLSLVFTRFLNLFGALLPELAVDYAGSFAGSFVGRFLFLLAAIVLTGVGAAMSLNMRLVPNPGDGIVQAIADVWGKGVGFTKNCFDLLNICITITVGLVCRGEIVGIGVGTVVAVLGVGRAIAVFNHFCKEKMDALAGMGQS